MIPHLQELLSIPSVAHHGEDGTLYGVGPAKSLAYMLNLCRDLGFRVKNADGKYGYAEIGQGKEIIGILGHLDVVDAGNGWHYPPFAGTIDDGKLYGRGTLDDKGPMLISLYAAKAVAEKYAAAGKELPKRIRLIFGQTEENGDWYDMDAYVENEEPVSYGFTPDGDFPAIFCEKGILVMDWVFPRQGSGLIAAHGGTAPNVVPDHCVVETVTGRHETFGKTGHGSAPWNGINAINVMMHELAQQDIPFAETYLKLLGDDVHGEKLGIAQVSPISGPLSLNVGMLRLTEDEIRLTVDIRYPEDGNADELIAQIREKIAPYGATIPQPHPMKPVYLAKDGSVMQCLLRAYQNETGDCGEPLAIGGGTYARAMDNIIAFGPNFPGEPSPEHEPDEFITLANIEKLYRIYQQALENLLELP